MSPGVSVHAQAYTFGKLSLNLQVAIHNTGNKYCMEPVLNMSFTSALSQSRCIYVNVMLNVQVQWPCYLITIKSKPDTKMLKD